VSLGTAIKDDVFKVKKSFRNRERHWLSDDGVGSTTIGIAKYGGNKLGDF
jgi:glycine cleavage system H lipoate-binding protein